MNAPPPWLTELALRMAADRGDSLPRSAEYVETTRQSSAARICDIASTMVVSHAR